MSLRNCGAKHVPRQSESKIRAPHLVPRNTAQTHGQEVLGEQFPAWSQRGRRVDIRGQDRGETQSVESHHRSDRTGEKAQVIGDMLHEQSGRIEVVCGTEFLRKQVF